MVSKYTQLPKAETSGEGGHPWFLHLSPPAANPPPPPADLISLIFIQSVWLPPSPLLLHTLTQVTTIFCPHYCSSLLTSLPELSLVTPLHIPFCGQSDLYQIRFPCFNSLSTNCIQNNTKLPYALDPSWASSYQLPPAWHPHPALYSPAQLSSLWSHKHAFSVAFEPLPMLFPPPTKLVPPQTSLLPNLINPFTPHVPVW